MESKSKMKFHVLAIFAIIIFCAVLAPLELQNDTFYTVKIGEHIVQNGIDGQDPFSWHEGLSYTYPHWLYDVIMFVIYHLGGWTGIYISTILLTCVLGVTLYATNAKLTKNPVTSFFLSMGAMYLLKSFIAARAQLVTFILFVFAIYWIERFLATKKKRYGVGLILLSLLIANLHVAVWPFYFVLFLPYIAEYVICLCQDKNLWLKTRICLAKLLARIIRKEKSKQKQYQRIERLQGQIEQVKQAREQKRKNPYKISVQRNDHTKWLILVMFIAVLMGLCTPMGDTPYTYLIKTMQGTTTQSINEHQPLTLINQKDVLCLMGVTIAMICFIDLKIRLRDLFMIGGLILLSLFSKRQISLLFVIGIFVFNQLICAFLDKYDKGGVKAVLTFMNTLCGRIITISLIIIACMLMLKPRHIRNEQYVRPNNYPIEASQYILDHLDVNQIKLYNEYNYGSYLLYREIPVFIDSRADLYDSKFNEGTNIFNDFISVSNMSTHYDEIFDKYGITHVILYNNAKMNLFMQKDWKYEKIYKDDFFVIYEKKN